MADLIAELEACPFCGGMAQVRIPTERDGFAAHVSCHCGAQLYGHKRHFANEQEAIAAWNTRTHHAEIAAAVRDAKRWRYVVENSEWIRDEEDTLMAFRFEDDRPNLESVGMRTDAIDSAMRAGEGEG